MELLRAAGVEVDPDTLKPALDLSTLETNVPGLYVAGAVVSGRETGRIFIENGRFHGEAIVAAIMARSARPSRARSRASSRRSPGHQAGDQSADSTMGRTQMFRKRTGWAWSWRPSGPFSGWAS